MKLNFEESITNSEWQCCRKTGRKLPFPEKMYVPNIISLFSKLETFDYLENPKICTGIDILMNQYN